MVRYAAGAAARPQSEASHVTATDQAPTGSQHKYLVAALSRLEAKAASALPVQLRVEFTAG